MWGLYAAGHEGRMDIEPPLLRLLGTGTAFCADGRLSQSIYCDPGSAAAFLVDAGPTALAAMRRFEVAGQGLERLFLTHLHGDHVAGWPFLLLNMKIVERRTRRFDVHGPTGTRETLRELCRLCYGSALDEDALGFPLHYHEIPVEQAQGLDGGGVPFDVLPLDHHASSIGYRFRMAAATLAVSGDTGWCEALEELASGADVLVLECTFRKQVEEAHLALDEIRAGREALRSREILLVHLTDSVAADLAADPILGVTAGYDGMAFPLR